MLTEMTGRRVRNLKTKVDVVTLRFRRGKQIYFLMFRRVVGTGEGSLTFWRRIFFFKF